MLQKIKQQIPNLFTLANLCCGVLAIYIALFEDASYARLQLSGYLVLLAALLDFFDGFVARALKVSGEFGKQLDSLADMVTFGVAPGFIVLSFAKSNAMMLEPGNSLLFFLMIPVFSAYRLAKFNIDTRQSDSFIGVPTPTNAILCLSFPFIHDTYPQVTEAIFGNYSSYILFCIITSLMLVAEIPLVALKFKGGLKNNISKLVLIGIGAVLIALFHWLAVPIIYIVYILYSVFLNFAEKNKSKTV